MLLAIALVLALIFLPWPLNAAVVFAAGLLEGSIAFFGIRYTRRRRASVGVETLLGQQAEVITPLDPVGQVKLNGEIWRGQTTGTLKVGEIGRVTAVHGLTVELEPISPAP